MRLSYDVLHFFHSGLQHMYGLFQAVDVVSNLISKGSFDELEGLVARDVSRHYT